MNKLIASAAIALLVSGCMSFEFPNLISDSVKAAKDAMGGASSQKPEATNKTSAGVKGIVFSNTVIGEAGAAPKTLEDQCLKELEAQAKEKLGTNRIAYKIVARELFKKEERLVATCSLEIV